MTMTRKALITEKYNVLRTQLTKTGYFQKDIFPSLSDEIDVSDLIFFFQLSFPDSNKYTEAIDEMLQCHSIKLKNKERTEVINIILPFLEMFRNIT